MLSIFPHTCHPVTAIQFSYLYLPAKFISELYARPAYPPKKPVVPELVKPAVELGTNAELRLSG